MYWPEGLFPAAYFGQERVVGAALCLVPFLKMAVYV